MDDDYSGSDGDDADRGASEENDDLCFIDDDQSTVDADDDAEPNQVMAAWDSDEDEEFEDEDGLCLPSDTDGTSTNPSQLNSVHSSRLPSGRSSGVAPRVEAAGEGHAKAAAEQAGNGHQGRVESIYQRQMAVSLARVATIAAAARQQEELTSDCDSQADSPYASSHGSPRMSPRGSLRQRPQDLPRRPEAPGMSQRRPAPQPALTKVDLAPPASRERSSGDLSGTSERVQRIMDRLQRLQLQDAIPRTDAFSGPPSPRDAQAANMPAQWAVSTAGNENYTATAASSVADRLGRASLRAPSLGRPTTAGRIGSASNPDRRTLQLRRNSASGRQLLRHPALDAGRGQVPG